MQPRGSKSACMSRGQTKVLQELLGEKPGKEGPSCEFSAKRMTLSYGQRDL